MFGNQTVVVAKDAIGLRAELVGCTGGRGERREFRAIGRNVKKITVDFHPVEAMRVDTEESIEDLGCGFVVASVVVEESLLLGEEGGGWKDGLHLGEVGVDFGGLEVELLAAVDVEEEGDDAAREVLADLVQVFG